MWVKYSIVTLVLVWFISYLHTFQNINLNFRILGFNFSVFFMLPGLLAIILTIYSSKNNLFLYLKNFGKLRYWLFSFLFPIIASGSIIGLAYLFGKIRYTNPDNVETLFLNTFFDFPLLLLWSIPSLLLAEIGWRAFLFNQINIKSSVVRAAVFSSIIWTLSYLLIVFGQSGIFSLWLAIPHLLYIFTNGIFICWVFIKTKSIWAITFLHFNMNLWNIFLFGIGTEFSPLVFKEKGIFVFLIN